MVIMLLQWGTASLYLSAQNLLCAILSSPGDGGLHEASSVLICSYKDLLTNINNRGQRDGGLCDELAVNGEKQLLFTDGPVEFQE